MMTWKFIFRQPNSALLVGCGLIIVGEIDGQFYFEEMLF